METKPSSVLAPSSEDKHDKLRQILEQPLVLEHALNEGMARAALSRLHCAIWSKIGTRLSASGQRHLLLTLVPKTPARQTSPARVCFWGEPRALA